MREDDSLVEELQQEDVTPAEEAIEEVVVEEVAPVADEADFAE